MKTATILARAGRQLQDAGFVRWTSAALLDYLNVGVRRVKALLPDKFAVSSTVALTAGSVEQAIPANTLQFLRPVRNMGANGATPGLAIHRADKSVLDAYTPAWRHSTGAAVLEWAPDGDDRYLVNPAPLTAIHIEYLAVPMPAALVNATDEVILLPDRYELALLHFVLAAAFSEDTETGGAALAQAHGQGFMAELGVSSGTA